jgi:hypothetical protein
VPTLRELQRRFAAALFADASEPLGVAIRPAGVDGGARIDIYRDQLHAVFAHSLALEYPVIERLVGSQYFQRLAFEFQTAHPSRAGDLQHIGAPFAAFLQERYPSSPYGYLADVAALEWALQESMVAPAAQVFDLHALRGVDPADYAQLLFEFHPACRLVSSPYPVLDIWHANQPGRAAGETIDLASGMTRVLVHRAAGGVEFHDLSAPEFALLETLARNSCLDIALQAAQQIDAAFDLGAALRRVVALGAVTGALLQVREPVGPRASGT